MHVDLSMRVLIIRIISVVSVSGIEIQTIETLWKLIKNKYISKKHGETSIFES